MLIYFELVVVDVVVDFHGGAMLAALQTVRGAVHVVSEAGMWVPTV